MKRIIKNVALRTAVVLAVTTIGAHAVYAQEDAISADADQVLNSEQIDIDGSFHRKAEKSEADKQADYRRKLEKDNENLVRKKIEDVRLEQERKMTEDLKNAFKTGLGNLGKGEAGTTDTVVTTQAAPQKVEAVAPILESKSFSNEGKIKVIPSVGIVNIQGDGIDFESKVAGGIAVESMVSRRFSFGIGFNYSTLDAKDIDSQNNGIYNGNTGYNNWYNTTYGQGRDMSYNHLLLELNSKFFLAAESRVKPFVGLGLGYNRTNLKFKDKGQMQTFQNYNVQYGDEQFVSNYVSASAIIGSEVSFNETMGMNLDLRYSKGLTSGFGTKSEAQSALNEDQIKLNNVGQAISESNFFSVNVGILVAF